MGPTCRIRFLLLISISFASAAPTIRAQANPPPVWTYQADSSIRWYKTTPPGVLLIGTEREILGISPDSGKVVWRLGPIRNSNASDVELLAHSAAAVLTLRDRDPGLAPLSLINLRDGRAVWTSATLGVNRSVGSFLIPGTDRLLVRATLSSDGNKDTAILVDLATGVPIWTNEALGRHRLPYTYRSNLVYPHYALFLDTDSTMIVAMLDALFAKFNLRTGETIWEVSASSAAEPSSDNLSFGDALRGAGHILGVTGANNTNGERKLPEAIEFRYAPILKSAGGDRFYAPYKGTVAAFSIASGECLWTDPPTLMGLAAQMAELPAGLLVRVVEPSGNDLQHRIVLLDKETGAVNWTWPKSYWTAASNFVVEDSRVVIAAEEKIHAVDVAARKAQVLAKLKFEGIDDANSLLPVPNGYLVIGRSNLGIYAKESGERIKKYYRTPPDDEGWGVALLGLSALTGLDPMLGLKKLVKDYSSSQESESFAYFLADGKFGNEKGTGIVRVKRDTGDVTGEILLGKKKPDYALDSDGRLYFRPDSKSIRCYRF